MDLALDALPQSPPTTGVLSFQGSPDSALVTIDGKKLGSAAAFRQEISADSHQVEISAEGYASQHETVAVPAGGEKSVQFALARLPEAPAQAEPGWTLGEKTEVQRALRALGHFQGEAEGGFGPRTRSAIKQFQSFEGAAETGVLSDSQRWTLLDMAQRLAALLDQAAV
jgi:hypothetical protein